MAAESLSVLPFSFHATPIAGVEPSCAVSVKLICADANLATLPCEEFAAEVPVLPLLLPADSTVRLIELSTVPLTESVPDEVVA